MEHGKNGGMNYFIQNYVIWEPRKDSSDKNIFEFIHPFPDEKMHFKRMKKNINLSSR